MEEEKKDQPTTEEQPEDVKYIIAGIEITGEQLWAYRELEAAFWGALDKFMTNFVKIIFKDMDDEDIKKRRMLARQAVTLLIVMDDGASYHASRTIHHYTGGHVGFQTEHADPHMTPVLTGLGVRVKKIVKDKKESD